MVGFENFGEDLEEEAAPAVVGGVAVGAQYVLTTTEDYRPKIKGFKCDPGTKLYAVCMGVTPGPDGTAIAEVELLGPKETIKRDARAPPAAALEGICLSTTGLLKGVPGSCLTASAGAQVFTPEVLDFRRKNLESLTKGLASYMEHVPMVVQAREAVALAKRRRDELAEKEREENAPPARVPRLAGPGGGRGASPGVVIDDEDAQSKGGENVGVGAGGAPARSGPATSQVSLGSQGAGVRQLDDILAQAAEEEEGVPSHLVFAQKVNLNVPKHTPAPLALFEFKYVHFSPPHFPLQDNVYAGVGWVLVLCLQGLYLCRTLPLSLVVMQDSLSLFLSLSFSLFLGRIGYRDS